MQDAFRFADELGPDKVLYLHEPGTGLRAIVVVDNVARGPAIGGVRMAPDVSLEECFRLARAMTFKDAAAGLAHGGGKSVIFADPGMPPAEKERLIRAFARAIADVTDYIPGPDMGTDERAMAWVHDENGRAAGLPAALGGIPLDEIGATAWGLLAATEVAREYAGLELEGARVVVQGFGAVGRHAANFLARRGAVLVGVADSTAALSIPDGIDLACLNGLIDAGQRVADYPGGEQLHRDEAIGIPCDIWIPAARPDAIREDNVERLDTKLVVCGANVPITPAAERRLHERGIVVVPDFIANAGGVICIAVELRGGTPDQALDTIATQVAATTATVLEDAHETGATPHEAALSFARQRVTAAMDLRRRV